MSLGESVGLALAAGVAAEATGVTNFSGDRGSDGGGGSGPPIQLPTPEGPDTAAIIEAVTAAQQAAGGDDDGPDVSSIAEAFAAATRANSGPSREVVVNLSEQAEQATGGVTPEQVRTWIEENTPDVPDGSGGGSSGSGSGGSGDDGPIFDFTREGTVAEVGLKGPAVTLTDDPTGLVQTGEDVYNRVNEFGNDMTDNGELGRTARRIAEGENPVDVVNEEGDGPISDFTRWASSGGGGSSTSSGSSGSSSRSSSKKSTGTKIEETLGLDNITAPFQKSSGRERQRDRKREERRSRFGVL